MQSSVRRFLALLATIVCGSDATGQWQQQLAGTAGQNDLGLAAAPHGATGQLVTVGEHGCVIYEGRRARTVSGPVPTRRYAAMAFDSARNRTVLYGGAAIGGGELGDTWEWDGATWTQLPAIGPGPRSGAALAYDSWRQQTILAGGFLAGLGQGDTWRWDGTAWSPLPTNLPGLRGGGCAAFDELRGLMILFGGETVVNGPIRYDHWQFDGAGWIRILQPTMPPGRAYAAMAFDPFTGQTTMFGGDSGGGTLLGDTWTWDGARWTQGTGAAQPAARRGHALAYDPRRLRIALCGGQSVAGARGEVFALTTDPRPVTSSYGASCSSRQLSVASPPALGGSITLNVGTPAPLLFVSLGFDNVMAGGQPLPIPLPASGTCELWLEPAANVLLPGTSSQWSLPIPNRANLAGTQFFVQAIEVAPSGTPVFASTNSIEARVGTTVVEQVTTAALDAATTEAETSALGIATLVGGDGRHGSFDPTVGTAVAPGIYEFDTDHTVIPGRLTLGNQTEVVADGRYFFTDFVLPAGTTVRFRGSKPAVLYVRGNVRIDGTIDGSGDALTTFASRGTTPAIPGQPGGRPGAGGGAGGRGGDRCLGTGPTIVGGINRNDGENGRDVQLPAGHAYAAQAAGTGGSGSLLYPASGLDSSLTYLLLNLFSGQIAAGGGGGGNRAPGGAGSVVPQPNLQPGPNTQGGTAFGLPVVPAGTSSLAHYAVGGAGGGGGGSHPFLAIFSMITDLWRAGAGGSGGGGAIAIRCGRDLLLGTTGRILASGGDGAIFSDLAQGIPSPGGAGAGGSILLQASGTLTNLGQLDVSARVGSAVNNITPATLAAVSNGGGGADGILRLESPQPISGGTTSPALTAADLGPLLDTDARTGLRSIWLPVGTGSKVLLRYELTVTWNGSVTTFSDDPAVGPPLAAPNGPLVARFQGTRATVGGLPDPAQAGPWRAGFGAAVRQDNCNRDVPDFVRIDFTFPSGNRPVVQGLRLYWR